MALKPRHRKFVAEYLVDQNATKAAIRAGYSNASAHNEGSRLIRNDEVRAEIEKGLAKFEDSQRKRAEAHGITKEWWLRGLKRMAEADMDAFVEIEQYFRYQGKSGKKYYGTRAKAIASKIRKAGLGQLIKKISEGKHGVTIELHSKQFAYELIGKHFGWAKDHVHHSGGTADVVAVVDEKALRKALAKIQEDF